MSHNVLDSNTFEQGLLIIKYGRVVFFFFQAD